MNQVPTSNSDSPTRDVAVELYNLLYTHSKDHAERLRSGFIETRTLPLLDEDKQIQQLNQFWRYELGSLPIDTIKERSALCESVSVEVWIANFKKYIFPTIVKYTCPIQSFSH